MENPTKTYRGNCHCGAYVYEAQLPEITTVTECNCSICYMKGYLFVRADRNHFKFVKGDEDKLNSYTFGEHKIQHKFCPTCAIGVMCTMSGATMLNAHAIQGLNTWTLTKKPFDGKNHGPAYVRAPHKGEEPSGSVDGGKLYTGSCHCGNLTVAVNSKPLDETYSDKVILCNCSICERGGFVWSYPQKDNVVVSGDPKDMGGYSFARYMLSKVFCKKCGVTLVNARAVPPPSAEQLALMPKEEYEKIDAFLAVTLPVNLRVLDGVDMSKLKCQMAEGDAMWPAYVNP